MGLQLHETMYGQNFFEHQLPALINALERSADTDGMLLVEMQNQKKNVTVKTKLCTFNELRGGAEDKVLFPSLENFINEVGYENVLNILPCGVQQGECYYTVIYQGQ